MNIYPYVYRLDHPTTGEFYIGFRWANKVSAQLDLGHKYFTSSDTVKPRFSEFNCTIVAEFFDKDAAYELEQQLIHENWDTIGRLNKVCHYGKGMWSNAGSIMTDETKKKISDALKGKTSPKKGRKLSEETKKKLSNAGKGKTHSEETKKKMSESGKGRKLSDEHKRNIAAGWKNRRPASEDTRKRMSDAQKERWQNTRINNDIHQ